MNIKILKEENNKIEIRFENQDATFGAALKDELWSVKGVEAAALNKRHPLVGKPELIVHGKDGKKAMKEAAQSYAKKVEDFEKQIMKEL